MSLKPRDGYKPTRPLRTQESRHETQVERLTHLLACTLRYAALQHQQIEKMSHLALKDELTGLYNRRGFVFLARQQLKIARRTHRRLLLIYADVNGLKKINDTWGHAEGDRILRQAADVLRDSIRDSDILARVGGDEFVILVSDATIHTEHRIAMRLARNARIHNARAGGGGTLSLSLGFSKLSGSSSSVKDMMTQADQDMYRRRRLSGPVLLSPGMESLPASTRKQRSA